MKPSAGKILAAIYVLAAGFAWYLHGTFRPPDEAAWLGMYALAALCLLTFPWSVALLIFAWGLVHDTTGPIFLIYFAGSAAANAYFINRAAA